jgi:hypothetical protein
VGSLYRGGRLAENADDPTRYAALDLLGGVTHHDDRKLAQQAIRRAHESGTDDDRERLAWLINEIGDE